MRPRPATRRAYPILLAGILSVVPGIAAALEDVPSWSPVPIGLAHEHLLCAEPCSGLLWSPDGRWLAIATAGGRLGFLRPYETDTLDTYPAGWLDQTRMCWSPDGRVLYYCEKVPHPDSRWRSHHRIMRIDPSSKSQACLLDSLPDLVRPHPIEGGIVFSDAYGENARFVPDPSYAPVQPETFAFVQTCRRDSSRTIHLDVFVIRPTGREALFPEPGSGHRLVSTVSPAGDRVVVMGSGNGILVVDIEGRAGHCFAPGMAAHSEAWHPAGEWILFLSGTDDGHRILTSDVYAVSTRTGEVRRLTETSLIETRLALSPDGRRLAFQEDWGGVWIADVLFDSSRALPR